MNIKIIAGVIVLIVVLLSKKPLLFFFKLISNCIFGMTVIFAFNSIIPQSVAGYNWFSIAVSSALGVPGAVLLCLLDRIL